MKSRFCLSVLITAGSFDKLSRYMDFFSLSDNESRHGLVEFVIGTDTPVSCDTIHQRLGLSSSCEIQTVYCQKADSMTQQAELVFGARGECLFIVGENLEAGAELLNKLLSLTLQSPDNIPLKECFYWGSTAGAPASYTLFGDPVGTKEQHVGSINSLLVGRRNWLRAIAMDNSLLMKSWNDRSWHQALSASCSWDDLARVTTQKAVKQAAPEKNAAPAEPKVRTKSELDEIIPPEIKHDEFYHTISDLASTLEISTILEIGSSSGGGSTEAFVNGLAKNPHKPTLYCLEVSLPRFEALNQRYGHLPYVKCLNASSVPITAFPSRGDVEVFYTSHQTILNQYPLEQVLGWLEQDLRYINEWDVPREGIEVIKSREGIKEFDLVLIDGSEFSGEAELERVYGARYILLDDVASLKNFKNRERLLQDKDYELIRENLGLRNGYSVFKRKSSNNRQERAEASLNAIIKKHQIKKIIRGELKYSTAFRVLPEAKPELDLCLIESDHTRAEQTKNLYRNRGISCVLLVPDFSNDGKKANQTDIMTVSSPAAVALGRFHYRPDLIVLHGESKSFLNEWRSISCCLMKNCLIAAINTNHLELVDLVQSISQKNTRLRPLLTEPENGVVFFCYEHSASQSQSSGSPIDSASNINFS